MDIVGEREEEDCKNKDALIAVCVLLIGMRWYLADHDGMTQTAKPTFNSFDKRGDVRRRKENELDNQKEI